MLKPKWIVKGLSSRFFVICSFVAVGLLLSVLPAAAQDAATAVATESGLSAVPLPVLIGRIIAIGLAFVGVIVLVLFIYAGFLWMTAGGDDGKVEQAKKLMVRAVIGLVIVLMSYAITTFVINALTNGSGIFGPGNGGEDDGGVSIEPFSGSYGNGIRDHYPGRGQTGVPRNSKIFVTFSEPMDPESFISGYDNAGTPGVIADDNQSNTLNASTVKIYKTADGDGEAFEPTEVAVSFTDDLKTYVFTPPLLGSATENTQYTVFLSENLRTVENERIIRDSGYRWFFTVGTTFDNTPPTVTDVIPVAGKTYAKNILVEIDFSEPIDPTSATGMARAALGLQILNGQELVEGLFEISNQYRTITFTPSTECGQNSCGDVMYCLPASADITTIVAAATVGATPPLAGSFPYDGVVDMVGNALDGDGDGEAGDDYTWSFATSGDTQLSAPQISSVSPAILGQNVALDAPVIFHFNSRIASSTLNSDTVDLMSSPEHSLWYSTARETIDEKTVATINHGVFLKSNEDQQYAYGTQISNQVRDIYQNCFNPANGPGLNSESCGTTSALPYCCNGTAQASACTLF